MGDDISELIYRSHKGELVHLVLHHVQSDKPV